MILKKSYVFKALLLVGGVVFFASCEKEFNTLGSDLVENPGFEVSKRVFEVDAANRELAAVRTDLMPMYELSDYTDPVFGKSQASYISQLSLSVTSPTFGELSEAEEAVADSDEDVNTVPENETVTKVYLDIPFFGVASDTLDDKNLPIPYKIDSVFGDVESPVRISVQEYTKFLRQNNPATNFQGEQEYYSNEDPQPFLAEMLYDDNYLLNFEELRFFDNQDDPDTEEDESEDVSSRLSPRIRLELDNAFFQERIIDMEGKDVLENQELFRDYLRGIYVNIDHPADDLKMLLNTIEGSITIKYDYDAYNEESEAIEVARDSFVLSLGRKAINVFSAPVYPSVVNDAVAAGIGADRLYLKGQSGIDAVVDISAGEDMETFMSEAKANDWLLNEASLLFYVDETASDLSNLPERLYLYDSDNSIALLDYTQDPVGAINELPQLSYLFYDGRLQNEEGSAPYYKFRVTEHLKNIINNDSTNVRLGLAVTRNILDGALVSAINKEGAEVVVPRSSINYPSGVVLYGAAVPAEEQDKRVRMEVIYTEPNN